MELLLDLEKTELEFGGKVRLILGTCPQKGFVDEPDVGTEGIEASLLDPCHVPLLSNR